MDFNEIRKLNLAFLVGLSIAQFLVLAIDLGYFLIRFYLKRDKLVVQETSLTLNKTKVHKRIKKHQPALHQVLAGAIILVLRAAEVRHPPGSVLSHQASVWCS
jgi:hypothetical protein